jgi:hypothetical protein
MVKRGRKSAASLEVVTRPVEIVERQRPPYDLNDEETEIWQAVVETQAADWFTAASAPILAEYCRQVIHARRIGQMIEQATSHIDPDTKEATLTIEDYDRLLRMSVRASAAIAMLATKLRIAPQSLTNHRGNKAPRAAKKPWEGE